MKTPQEELSFVYKQVGETGTIRELLASHKENAVLDDLYHMHREEQDALILGLSKEKHDHIMEELLGILLARGIKNTMTLVEKLGDPHIEQDFHRFLVAYVASGGEIPELKKNRGLFTSLHMKLYRLPNEYVNIEQLCAHMKGLFSLDVVQEGGMTTRYIAVQESDAKSVEEITPHAVCIYDDYALFSDTKESVGVRVLKDAKLPLISLKEGERYVLQCVCAPGFKSTKVEESIEKFRSTLLPTTLRMVVVAKDKERLGLLGKGFVEGKNKVLHEYAYRLFSKEDHVVLNLKEIAGLYN